jgi:predicted phosphodiesterase
MKLAVLADIHANLAALQAVVTHVEAWQPDAVIVAGDIVNRGPCPRQCLRLVQARQQAAGWLVVRGNHEDYVINQARPGAARNGSRFEIFRSSYWTYQELGGSVAELEAMPFQVSLAAPDGSEVRIVHASMRSNRDGIYPETTDEELRRQISPPPPLFCVGHTHRPLVRMVDQTLVVNVGSAGLPFDGDVRVSYGQLTWQQGRWYAQIIRLEYDRTQAERDFFESGFMTDSGPLAPLILDEFYMARSRLYQWASRYQAQVLAGTISLEASVRATLDSLHGSSSNSPC